VINILSFTIFLAFLTSCSLHDSGGFWSKEKNLKSSEELFKPILKEEKKVTKEFNKDFKLSLTDSYVKANKFSHFDNNDGFTLFKGELGKIKKYNFSKIKNFHKFEPNLIFYNNNIIFFDNKGSILSFNEDSKLVWKTNNYSKDEKKIGPLITMEKDNNRLIVSDSLAKTYALDIVSGKILWSKKNKAPFNSQIKIHDKKFFIIDSENTLNCFLIVDGSKCWTFSTEKSFVNSSKKLSIVLKKNFLIFNNSLGDVTALEINNGSLLWQMSTLNSTIYEDIMSLKTSNLIENENSIYFSNNKNEFYSLDLNTGTVNWKQKINSNLKPCIIGNLIFTISLDGYFYIIEKNSGNIIRIINLFNQNKLDKKKLIYPTGFILNSKQLYISTNIGKLVIVDIKSGKVKKILNIDNDKISRAFVQKQDMFLVRNNSIIKLN
jgi:outer membrane protein assembly factor BamB